MSSFDEAQGVGTESCELGEKEYLEEQQGLNEVEHIEKECAEEGADLTAEEVKEGLEAFDEPSTPKSRLRAEIEELGEKIDKLHHFLNKRNEDGVRVTVALRFTEAQTFLLHEQVKVMEQYYNILVSRYSIFDARVGNEVGEVEIVKEN